MDASSGRRGPRRSSRPTISDVAERAGVDRAVVSKVLSEDPSLRVRAETRERVRRAASDLGYRPNFHARSLARSRAGALGLLMPEGNPLFAELMAGAEEVATERDLLLWTATHDGHLAEPHRRLLQGGVVDALLVTGLDADVDAHELFVATRVPMMLVNRRSKGSDRWVILDDARAAEIATRHLVDLGHTIIAFLGGPRDVDTAERRADGYRAAMEAAGLAVDPSLVVDAAYTSAAGDAAVHALLRGRRRPTAIVAADAPLGLGAWHALETLGLRVPGDVSLIAIHRPPLEEFRVPALSCVELPLRALGRRAAELVLDTPPEAPIHESVRDGIVLFEGSTVAPRHGRGPVGRAQGGRGQSVDAMIPDRYTWPIDRRVVPGGGLVRAQTASNEEDPMKRGLFTVGAAAALLATTVAGTAAQSPGAAAPGSAEEVIASLSPELASLYDHYAGAITLADAPDVAGNPGPWKFCYSESYQGNPWRVALTNETKRLADEFIAAGVLSEFVMTDANGDVPTQISQIQSFIDQGCDVILTIPGSATGLDGVIQTAYDAGIPVITNSGAATSPHAINVDSNWYRWGYDMMTAIGNEIGEGNVLVVEGIAGAPIVAMQAEGREAALAQFPGLKVVATVNGDWTPTTTQTVITQTLATNPADIDAVWTSGSESRIVTEAFKAAGREVPLVTGSTSGDALGYWHENPDGYRFTGNAVLPVPTANSGFRAALRTIMGQQPLLNTILVELPAITQADLPDWFSACMTPDSGSIFPQPATDPYPEDVFDAYFANGAATPPYDYANTPDPCG